MVDVDLRVLKKDLDEVFYLVPPSEAVKMLYELVWKKYLLVAEPSLADVSHIDLYMGEIKRMI